MIRLSASASIFNAFCQRDQAKKNDNSNKPDYNTHNHFAPYHAETHPNAQRQSTHDTDNNGQNYRTSQYTRDYTFMAMVRSYDSETGLALVEQRNKMTVGDEIEVFGPGGVCFRQQLDEMYDAESGEAISSAPHPKQLLLLRLRQPCGQYFMLRKRKEEKC